MRHTVSEVQLKNGARGLLIDIPGANVTNYEFNFRAGEFLVDRKKWEVPHLTEHMIWGGANEEHPDRQAFQADIGRNGAYTNAYTSYYSISYVGEVADFELERVLRLQFKSLEKPLFLESEFDAESGNIRDELTSYTNNHFRHLSLEMDKAYGFSGVTDAERIKLMKNVRLEDIREHYKNTHYLKNMRFIIAGSLRGRRVAIKKLLEELNLPKGTSRIKLPEEKAKKPTKPIFIANETVPNIYFLLGAMHDQIINEKDSDALNIARVLLTETLYSKIFGQARDHGLVYHVSSGHHIASRSTGWWLNAQVLPENAPALCDIILTEIKKVQNGEIDESDLENAKQYALGSHQMSLQTVGNVSSAYARYFFDDYVEDLKSFTARIKSISKRDVTRAMNKMFDNKIGNVGVLGGTNPKITKQLYEQILPLWR